MKHNLTAFPSAWYSELSLVLTYRAVLGRNVWRIVADLLPWQAEPVTDIDIKRVAIALQFPVARYRDNTPFSDRGGFFHEPFIDLAESW